MQRLFDVGHPSEKHLPVLKSLWEDVFGDSRKVIDNFFNKTARLENIVCAFHGGKPVSVLYAIDSTVYLNGEEKKAYYVYAVCSHPLYRGKGYMALTFSFLEKLSVERDVSYLFLVPAEKSLFSMYEKLGFSVGFTRNRNVINKYDTSVFNGKIKQLSFENYINCRKVVSEVPQAILNEAGFNSFYRPVGDNMSCIYIEDTGFAVYETENGKTEIFELFGNKEVLLSAVFAQSGADAITLYEYDMAGGDPYGMIKSIDGSPCFKNGFFGVSYGG